METAFFTFITKLVAGGAITANGLIMSVIFLLLIMSFYIFKPMYKRIKEMPSKEEVKTFFDQKKEIDEAEVCNINAKLNKILDTMGKIDNLDENNFKEIESIRRDLENIKQSLNQFQGYMLYSKNDNFGNRELR